MNLLYDLSYLDSEPEDFSDSRTNKGSKKDSSCGENVERKCLECEKGALMYWCETCQRPVPEKRCPNCGLKARKVRSPLA